MKVLISGASGLIGQAVSSLLSSRLDEVYALVRDPAKLRQGDVLWQSRYTPGPRANSGFRRNRASGGKAGGDSVDGKSQGGDPQQPRPRYG